MSVDKYPKLFTPRYPLVIVEKLPVNTTYGSIIIPGDDNKVVHEGVVVKTWEPFERQMGYVKLEYEDKISEIAGSVCSSTINAGHDVRHCKLCTMIETAREMLAQREKYRRFESEFKPGDHICFPHYSGKADEVYKDLLWIPERNEYDQGGMILGRVEHERTDVMREMGSVLGAGYLTRENVISDLLEHFVIVPKRSATRGPSRG